MEYVITILLAVISSITTISTAIISRNTNKKVDSIAEVKETFEKQITEMKVENDKTYLTDFLSDLNNGEHKTEYQKQRASELYDFYTKNGGNSYIHTEWDKARSNGLI